MKQAADPPPLSPEPSALALSQKLLGLAQAQLEALQRDAQSQFEWLVLRRNLVTDRIQAIVASGRRLRPAEAAAVASVKDQLAQVDRAMEAHVRARLDEVRRKQAALARRRKAVSPYLSFATRRPAFIDKCL
jgi:hypothetical protein